MERVLDLSVHQLVDFLLRSGDIDNRVFNRSSMTEGSRIHSAYQAAQDSNYMSEYPLRNMFVVSSHIERLVAVDVRNFKFRIIQRRPDIISYAEFVLRIHLCCFVRKDNKTFRKLITNLRKFNNN